MKYAIYVTISTDEHNEDREEIRQQFLEGLRTAYNPATGHELGRFGFAALDLDTQNTFAEGVLGGDWDGTWLYPDGSEGFDPEPRWVFDTRQEAESAAGAARGASASLYEVVEICEWCHADLFELMSANINELCIDCTGEAEPGPLIEAHSAPPSAPDRMVTWNQAMEFATAVAIASGWPIDDDEEES